MGERIVKGSQKERNVLRQPTAEHFIGHLGWPFVFQTQDNRVLLPEQVIGQLELTMGHPDLLRVKATFSKLTQVMQIRGIAGIDFSYPEPGDPLVVPADIIKTTND